MTLNMDLLRAKIICVSIVGIPVLSVGTRLEVEFTVMIKILLQIVSSPEDGYLVEESLAPIARGLSNYLQLDNSQAQVMTDGCQFDSTMQICLPPIPPTLSFTIAKAIFLQTHCHIVVVVVVVVTALAIVGLLGYVHIY